MSSHKAFPLLNNGEKIIDQYTHNAICQHTISTATLTDQRLLLGSRKTLCCCIHRSSYKSISLESIDRIDENPQGSPKLAFTVIWLLFLLACTAGILLSIFFIDGDTTLRLIIIIISGVVFVLVDLILLIVLCCCFKRKRLQVNGSFGSVNFLLSKNKARSFEETISEEISRAKLNSLQSVLSPVVSSVSYALEAGSVKYDPWITSEKF